MNRPAAATRGYMRPMHGWWRRDPFFVRYMAREATALAVLCYSVILAVGVVRLAQGEAAWNAWLQALRSPFAVLLATQVLASRVCARLENPTYARPILEGFRAGCCQDHALGLHLSTSQPFLCLSDALTIAPMLLCCQ